MPPFLVVRGSELKPFNQKQVPRLKKQMKRENSNINNRRGWLFLRAWFCVRFQIGCWCESLFSFIMHVFKNYSSHLPPGVTRKRLQCFLKNKWGLYLSLCSLIGVLLLTIIRGNQSLTCRRLYCLIKKPSKLKHSEIRILFLTFYTCSDWCSVLKIL